MTNTSEIKDYVSEYNNYTKENIFDTSTDFNSQNLNQNNAKSIVEVH